jgi:hypothetical protein
MITPVPSTDKRSGSDAYSKRPILTPGTRWSASATERSGSAPISSRRDGIDESISVAFDILGGLQRGAETRYDDLTFGFLGAGRFGRS